MKKNIFYIALGAMLFALGVTVEAQQTKKVPRIGYLSTGSRSSAVVEAFQQGLRDLGYIEGQNITIEYRSTEGMAERLPNLAAELVQLKVDIIVVGGSPATQAAKKCYQNNPHRHDKCYRPSGNRAGRQSCAPRWECHRVV